MNNTRTLTSVQEAITKDPIVLLFLLVGILLLAGLALYFFKFRTKKIPISAPEESTADSEIDEIRSLGEAGWLGRLRVGLGKTRDSFLGNLQSLFKTSRANDELLSGLQETLYRSDIGSKAVERLVEHVRERIKGTEHATWESIKTGLSEEIERILDLPTPLSLAKPQVILVIGVNGVGKTTTIGKLAAQFLAEDKSVLICAADTFRAAAIDQLRIWGDRLKVKVIAHQEGGDPAAVAFDSVKAAVSRGVDVLLIDTAGRLHNKQHLMEELGKMIRVIKKELPEAPHQTLLVLDATTGQNAFMQLRAFSEVTKITGICVTKLDGTAKGGVIIGLANEFKIPIQYIGVGEKASDLRRFQAKEFVASLLN